VPALHQVWVSLIVEGHGEVQAAPTLVNRVAAHSFPDLKTVFTNPIRRPRHQVVRAGELERAVQFAATTLRGPGGVLVLLDADDDCPAELGPALLERARTVAGHVPAQVVLAKSMYESWLIAAAESLRGMCGLPADLVAPDDPESIRGAKGWLQRHMPSNRSYSETADQKKLTAAMDLDQASTTDSFGKLVRAVAELIRAVRTPS
jgi:hypothetical protein